MIHDIYLIYHVRTLTFHVSYVCHFKYEEYADKLSGIHTACTVCVHIGKFVYMVYVQCMCVYMYVYLYSLQYICYIHVCV